MNSKTMAVVNTVNCNGVMGRGLAAQFRRRYPVMFEAYAEACARGDIQVGRVWPWALPAADALPPGPPPLYVVNFPTKKNWWEPSQLGWVSAGLDSLVLWVKTGCVESIAVPALGCQNGGLSWAEVRPMIERKLEGLENCRVSLYAPHRSILPAAQE